MRSDYGHATALCDLVVEEASESTLDDNSGTAVGESGELNVLGLRGIFQREELHNWSCDAQQKVSRFQRRQLRFSNRLPSSIVSAHFEKTMSLNTSVKHLTRHHLTYLTKDRRDSPRSACR